MACRYPVYIIHEQKLLLGILFSLLMQISSKLLHPAPFPSFACCLSLCLLLSLFLVPISPFPVPRVPQSRSAEEDTIFPELSSQTSSLQLKTAARGTALFVSDTSASLLLRVFPFKQHCGCLKAVAPRVWNEMLPFPLHRDCFLRVPSSASETQSFCSCLLG